MNPKRMIKLVIKKINQVRREKNIRRKCEFITKARILNDIKQLGVREGDNLLLHSSLKSIGYVEGGALTVIEAILQVISSSGTLVVPTYSMRGTMYDTCQTKNYIFDPRHDTTGLGIIPATFLKLPGIQRSIHPTHSVSAIGRYAKILTEAHHKGGSTFGSDSPWDRLMKLDGKILGLGISLGPFTFYHVLEDMLLDGFPLPVRMKKTYMLKCRDWNGNLVEVPVNPHDPQFSKIRIDHAERKDLRDYFWKEFNKAGLLTVGKVGMATAWVAQINKFYDHLIELMRQGITIYSSPDELNARPILGTPPPFYGTK